MDKYVMEVRYNGGSKSIFVPIAHDIEDWTELRVYRVGRGNNISLQKIFERSQNGNERAIVDTELPVPSLPLGTG